MKPGELQHDVAVFRAARIEQMKLLEQGAVLKRVRIDAELKREIARATETSRARRGKEAPDAQLEYTDSEGRSGRVNVEIATEHYSAKSIGAGGPIPRPGPRQRRASRACREAGTRGPGTVPRRMKQQTRETHMTNNHSTVSKRGVLLVSILALSAGELMAQGTGPWLEAIDVLQQAFTGPIARGLSLIAVVVGGLMFAFGEGGSKKALAGIIFGLGMAMGAANFLAWLF